MQPLDILCVLQGLMTILMHIMFGNKLYTASSISENQQNPNEYGHAMLSGDVVQGMKHTKRCKTCDSVHDFT